MYRSKNENLNKQVFDSIKDNVAPNNKNEANNTWKMFRLSDVYYDNIEYYSSKLNESLVIGIGNILSKTIFFTDSVSDNKINYYIREILEKYGIKYHDIFVTQYKKCSDDNINNNLLKLEFDIIKPKFVLSFEHLKGFIPQGVKSDIRFLNKEKLIQSINMDSEKDVDINLLKSLKQELWNSGLKEFIKNSKE